MKRDVSSYWFWLYCEQCDIDIDFHFYETVDEDYDRYLLDYCKKCGKPLLWRIRDGYREIPTVEEFDEEV